MMSYIIFDRTIIGFFCGFIEIAGGKLAGAPVICDAFAADPIPGASRVSAITIGNIGFLIRTISHNLKMGAGPGFLINDCPKK